MTHSFFSRRPLWIALFLTLITGAVFHDVLSAGFVRWDDNLHVYDNPYLHPASVANLARFWSAPYRHLYVPVSYSLYWLLAHAAHLSAPVQTPDGIWVDLSPRVFHAANLLLHLVNVLLVFALLRRLLPSKNAGATDWAAGAGAMLFAVHPVQVESVAWISEMRGLLAGMLSLLALLAYVRSAGAEQANRWYFLATLLFALALLAKPSAVAVPLMAGLIDALILNRPMRVWGRALALWVLLCAGLLWITHGAQPVMTAIVTPLWTRPFIAGDALAFALGKMLWPASLGIDYGRSPVWVMTHGWAYWTGLLPLTLGILAWWWRSRFPWLTASYGLVIAALLPTLGLTPFVFQIYSTVADRYLYLALLGPALALAWGLQMAWKLGAWKERLRLAAGTACSVILLLCGLGSSVQTLCWQNSVALFTQALTVNPRSWGAANNLAAVLLDQGHPQEALGPLATALRLRPDYAEAHANLGVAWIGLGQTNRAEAEFRVATEDDPGVATAWNGLGATLLAQGHSEDAAAAFRQALTLQPGSPQAQTNLRLAQAALPPREHH